MKLSRSRCVVWRKMGRLIYFYASRPYFKKRVKIRIFKSLIKWKSFVPRTLKFKYWKIALKKEGTKAIIFCNRVPQMMYLKPYVCPLWDLIFRYKNRFRGWLNLSNRTKERNCLLLAWWSCSKLKTTQTPAAWTWFTKARSVAANSSKVTYFSQ